MIVQHETIQREMMEPWSRNSLEAAKAWLQMRCCQVAELIREGRIRDVLRKSFYFRKDVVAVELDLHSLSQAVAKYASPDVAIVEINTAEDLSRIRLEPTSRLLKARRCIRQSYRGFAFSRHGKAIGDVWYAGVGIDWRGPVHEDVKWLDIHVREGGVYLYDMYVRPEERGTGVAAPLLGEALLRLRDMGFHRAYGYYFRDNLPALWMHRLLRYKEISKRKASGFLSWKWSTEK